MDANINWGTIIRIAWGTSVAAILMIVVNSRLVLGHLPGDVVIRMGSLPVNLPFTSTLLISFAAAGAFYFLSSYFSRPSGRV